MLVLGIDPGTATTGYGLIKKNGQEVPTFVDAGLIETNKNGHPGERLAGIYRETSLLLKKYKPAVMAIEKIFFFINKKTVIRVSQAQGVLLLAAEDANVPVFEYAPGQVKLIVGGHGRADKKAVQKEIKNIFGLVAEKNKKTHFDNTADAIAVALCHIKLEQERG